MTLSVAGISRIAKEAGLADESQYFVKLADMADDACLVEAVEFKHSWTFHQDFSIHLKVLFQEDIAIDDLIGITATFFVLAKGTLKPIHAVVSVAEYADGNGDRIGMNLTLSSPLWLLAQQRHNRVFVDRSADDIAREIIEFSLKDIATLNVRCAAAAALPMTVQYQESDLDFVTRILAKEGIYLNLQQSDTQTIVQMVDAMDQVDGNDNTVQLRYAANSGAAKDDTHVYRISRQRKQSASQIRLDNTNPWLAQELFVNQDVQGNGGFGETDYWGLNYQNRREGQQLSDRLAKIAYWQSNTWSFKTTSRQLSPGMIIDLRDHPKCNGQYRVLEISLSGSQRAAANSGVATADKGYSCTAVVIPADVEFAPAYHRRKPVYGTFVSYIEEEVDDRGLYRIRLPFDGRSASDGAASLPTRLLQPLGGEDHGMHFPLAKGTEVSVTYENGDPDRPVIVGAHYNQHAQNPVTEANARQNLIQTRGGHQFLLDDTPDQEKIHLTTPEDKNHLTLSAAGEGHFAELVSEQGDVHLRAGKSVTFDSGEDQQYTVGANQTVHVKQDQELVTQEGKITQQAATDLEYSAGKDIHWLSREGAMSINCGATMSVQVADGLNQSIDDGDCQIQVLNGAYKLETGNQIVMNSQGNRLTIIQGDGAIQIDGSGNLTLNAPSVTVTADDISIKGGSIGNN